MAGRNPREELTVYELYHLAQGRRKEEWLHTSAVLAMIHNASGNAKRVKQPDDLNPMVRKRGGWMSYEEFAACVARGQVRHGS